MYGTESRSHAARYEYGRQVNKMSKAIADKDQAIADNTKAIADTDKAIAELKKGLAEWMMKTK
jgi:hypothetical protein